METLNAWLERLEAELAALKVKINEPEPKKFELWVPEDYEQYFFPAPVSYNYRGASRFTAGDTMVPRGLAFQSEADATEVGKYLAVIGKLCNAAKQLNEGKVVSKLVPWTLQRSEDSLVVIQHDEDFSNGPRFHSREAAETALGLLTDDEKATLVRGIA